MAKQVTYEIRLPFYKQGDDLARLLAEGMTTDAALREYASRLEDAASQLRSIADRTKGQAVEITADTHFIQITGPKKLLDALVPVNLVTIPEAEDNEEAE